jgi:hypothetical protein
MSGSTGELRQQIGEILATVRGLERQQGDITRNVERAVDGMQRDMSALKHEQRNAQQVTQGRLEILANTGTRNGQRLDQMEAEMKGLRESVTALQEPVQQWVSLRKRVYGLGALALSVAAVLWAIASPVWSIVAQKLFAFTVR